MKRILKLFCLIATQLFCLATAFADANPCIPCHFDDWVSCRKSNTLCNGYYVEPTPPFPGQSAQSLANQPTTVGSDEGSFLAEGNSIFTGNVHLIQGNRQVFADRAIVHRNAEKKEIDSIIAEGNLKLTEPGLRLDGTRAFLNLEDDTQRVENACFRLYQKHARGTADSIFIFNNKDRMVLRNTTYTTCAPSQNTWYFKARKIYLNKTTGRGQATHARFYVKDIPVFYMPYVDFPIDDRRKTGFLYPMFGNTNTSGLEFSAPFYWNIAPNYDATFTPRYLSERGEEMQAQFRYLLPGTYGDFNGSILPNDRKYQRFRTTNLQSHPLFLNNDPRVLGLQKGPSRRAFRANNTSYFNQNLIFNLQYQQVGDDNYFVDFGNSIGMATTTQLLQQGELNYQDAHLSAQARLQKYQTLHPFTGPFTINPYYRLPQILLKTNNLDLPCDFSFASTGDFTHFSHKVDTFTNTAFTTGDRLQFRPAIMYPIETPGWFIKPRLQWNFLSYSLNLSPLDIRNNLPSRPGMNVPMFDLDSGLIFERSLHLGRSPYIQTLEPKAYYLYVPFRNQSRLPNFDSGNGIFDYNQLFRDNRFSGLDRVGDANQITFALTSRFIQERTGSERINLTVGQIYYFSDRKVTACNPLINQNCIDLEMPTRRNHTSPIVGVASFRIVDGLQFGALMEWNPYKGNTNKKTYELHYKPDPLNVVTIRYDFLRKNPPIFDPRTQQFERIDQIDTSFAWGITRQWRLLGKWHYDFYNKRSDEFLLGIEQQGCCTAIRLSVSRFLEPNDPSIPQSKIPGFKKYSNAIYLQFVFKGFAGVGHTKINPMLKRAIPGYEWRGEDF